MFTGIIQVVAQILSFEERRLCVSGSFPSDDPIQLGESVAVNGCCLTVVSGPGPLCFDVSEETLSRTTLGALKTGDPINLERAMRPTDRLGGHIVQGHVDAVGSVRSRLDHEGSTVFEFIAPIEFDRYLIDKGSIAVDGISLTLINPREGAFEVAVIPHTLQHTNLNSKQLGDLVNLEFDLIAKYVEKLNARTAS